MFQDNQASKTKIHYLSYVQYLPCLNHKPKPKPKYERTLHEQEPNQRRLIAGIWRTDFESLTDALCSTGVYKIISWDTPGYGASHPPARAHTLDANARDADMALELMQVVVVDVDVDVVDITITSY